MSCLKCDLIFEIFMHFNGLHYENACTTAVLLCVEKKLFIITNDFDSLYPPFIPPPPPPHIHHQQRQQQQSCKKFFMFFHAEGTKVLFRSLFFFCFPPSHSCSLFSFLFLFAFITFNFTSISSLPLCLLQKCTGEEKQKKLFNAQQQHYIWCYYFSFFFFVSFSNVTSSFRIK